MATFLRRLRARIKYWNNAEELKKELDAHREMAAARFAADGTSERESRWKAARLLGNTTIAREDARAVWIARWIDQLLQDTRYALRTMRREWAFAMAASITLTLGLGVLVGVFTVFNAIYLKPIAVRDPGNLFGITETLAAPKPDDPTRPVKRIPYVVWDDMRAGLTTADVAAKWDHNDTLRPQSTGRGRAVRIGMVDDRFIETVGLEFERGSLPLATSEPVIAVTYHTWVSVLGSDPSAVGRTVWLGARPVTVSGILDRKFRGFPPQAHGGFMRLAQTRSWLKRDKGEGDVMLDPKSCCVDIYARARPGVSRAQAAAEIEARANASLKSFGLPEVRVVPWGTEMASRPGGVRETVPMLFALLFAGCGIVTLLACANIGNLQLARGLRRSREVAVRLALGAGRARIVRQLLTESAILSALGTVGGLAIAWTLPKLIMSFDNPENSALVYEPDAAVVGFAILIATAATLFFGAAPALRVTRIDWRSAAGNITGGGAGRLRGVLLAFQIALSLGLIASASLLSRGALRAAGGANAGFEFAGVHSYSFVMPSDSTNRAAYNALRDVLMADKATAHAGASPWRSSQPKPRVTIPGSTKTTSTQWTHVNVAAATLLKLPLVSGRWAVDDPRIKEVVVSRSLARALWNDENVIGRPLDANDPFRGKETYTIVGVMDEVQLAGPEPMPAAVSTFTGEYTPTILAGAGRTPEFQALAAQYDPAIRVASRSLLDDLRRQMEASFIGISIASGLGLIAILLASFGVFGVFAYIVEERRREIGLRLALGASRSQVRRSLLAATRVPVISGLAVGIVIALVGGYLLRSNLYGLSVLDPVSYLVVAAILAFAAMAATFIPLRRALRVDPAVTLRQD